MRPTRRVPSSVAADRDRGAAPGERLPSRGDAPWPERRGSRSFRPFGPAGGRSFPTGELAAVPARHTREHLSHAHATPWPAEQLRPQAAARQSACNAARTSSAGSGRRAPGVSILSRWTVPLNGRRRRVARGNGEPAVPSEPQAGAAVLQRHGQHPVDVRRVDLDAVDEQRHAAVVRARPRRPRRARAGPASSSDGCGELDRVGRAGEGEVHRRRPPRRARSRRTSHRART